MTLIGLFVQDQIESNCEHFNCNSSSCWGHIAMESNSNLLSKTLTGTGTEDKDQVLNKDSNRVLDTSIGLTLTGLQLCTLEDSSSDDLAVESITHLVTSITPTDKTMATKDKATVTPNLEFAVDKSTKALITGKNLNFRGIPGAHDWIHA